MSREHSHDEMAIAVRTGDGRKLDYLPRGCDAVPAALVEQSVTLRASIDADAPPWDRVSFKVWQEV